MIQKQTYIKPCSSIVSINIDELLQIPGASMFDNDGDGNTDQWPVIVDDPDGGIGAKHKSLWEDDEDNGSNGWD